MFLLVCLLCDRLVGRACRSGQANNYWLVGWLVGDIANYSLLSFDFGSVQGIECSAERGETAAVWKGLFLDLWGVSTLPPCRKEGLGVETSQEVYTATTACSLQSLSQWRDCCDWSAVGLGRWAANVSSDGVLDPFQYVCRLDSVC